MMPGVAYLYAGGDSKDAGAVTDAILKEAARIAAEGVDEDYFQRIRKASFGANLRGLNSFENIAVTLTEGYFHGYDPFKFPEVFDSITPEDVASFLKANVTPERMGGQPHCAENLTLWEAEESGLSCTKTYTAGKRPGC